MRLETIGIWRGISSAIGLLGTCVYHWSAKRTSLEWTGMWSICYEFLCLSLCFASLFVLGRTTALTLLIAGVCASRFGLWVFDIAVTQMMQENVPDGVRGVVGGVQQSLNAFFNLLSFLLGILFPSPSQFYVYVVAGYGSVGVAMLLFGFGTFVFPQLYKRMPSRRLPRRLVCRDQMIIVAHGRVNITPSQNQRNACGDQYALNAYPLQIYSVLHAGISVLYDDFERRTYKPQLRGF